jgi:hypothetical protein
MEALCQRQRCLLFSAPLCAFCLIIIKRVTRHPSTAAISKQNFHGTHKKSHTVSVPDSSYEQSFLILIKIFDIIAVTIHITLSSKHVNG